MVRERLLMAGLFGIPVALALVMMAWSTERSVSAQTTHAAAPVGPFVGLVMPSDDVDLASNDKGIIQEMTVQEGDTVMKGQVICRLESSVEEASLKISEAQAKTNIDIEAAQLRHELARIEYERVIKMDKEQAAAPKELDTARINEKYADSLVRKAQHDQKVAQFQYARDQKVVERRVIVSTLDGYVARKKKSVGELVDGVNDAVVCQILKMNPLHVLVPVPAATYGKIHLGDAAILVAEQLPGGRAKAKVILVDKVIQADSQTYTIKLELPNPESVIPTGIKADVTFP
jgi:RND family efflux transporter MFP subunit